MKCDDIYLCMYTYIKYCLIIHTVPYFYLFFFKVLFLVFCSLSYPVSWGSNTIMRFLHDRHFHRKRKTKRVSLLDTSTQQLSKSSSDQRSWIKHIDISIYSNVQKKTNYHSPRPTRNERRLHCTRTDDENPCTRPFFSFFPSPFFITFVLSTSSSSTIPFANPEESGIACKV